MPKPSQYTPKQLTRTERFAIQGLVKTLFLLVVILPFGFLLDLPSRVSPEGKEGFWVARNLWLSAAFYTALPLIVLSNAGVWGFALIPLMVLIIVRRLSAHKAGAPYQAKKLYGDVTEFLQASFARGVVFVATALTLVLQTATLIWPFLSFLASVAATVIWGTWIYVAYAVANKNVAAVEEELATRDKYTPILSTAFGVPAAAWEKSVIGNTGVRLTVTPPPPAAVLHYSKANAALAEIAPDWEINLAESNNEVLVLDAASEETKQRRAEEAQSGGLIGGKLSDAEPTFATRAYAGLAITDDELV